MNDDAQERILHLEEELARRDAFLARCRLLPPEDVASWCHDVKTCMVTLALDLTRLRDMARSAARPDKLEEVVKRVTASYERVRSLHEYLVDKSRRALKPGAFLISIRQCLEEAATNTRRRMRSPVGLRLDVDEVAGRQQVADDCRIAFELLLENAFEAAALSPGRAGSVVVECVGEADSLIIRVKDNGPGIPALYLNKMWEFGFTTRPGKAGIGLNLVKQVLSANGGSILAQSATSGTEFLVTLPLRKAPNEDAAMD